VPGYDRNYAQNTGKGFPSWKYRDRNQVTGFEVVIAVPVKSCLLGHNNMQSVESQLKFRKNMSPPSLDSKNMPSKKSA
jgi:hypothetical protein